MKYLDKIKDFDENSLPSLDEVVMGTLELFENSKLKKLNISIFKKPLIAGSGNAIVTARIIFSETNAIFTDEIDFDKRIDEDIDGLIIISASGEKHARVFTEKVKNKGIKTLLLTCNKNSSSGKILGKENTIITEKLIEPYTYNTSTYLGWILSYTGEKPRDIKIYIENTINPIIKNINFKNFDSFLLMTPDKFSKVNQLFTVKFIELFGRKIARDVFSYEQLKHAITVIPHEKELKISFGIPTIKIKGNNLNIPLPEDCNLGMIISIGYYIIGKIQNSYPQYFKKYIGKYIEDINKTDFGKGLKVIVK